METPVGNPNVSLLPQPATPAPIEAMRGGGAGAGNETVSLLPQPANPVPIEPMKGGGSVPYFLGVQIEPIITKDGVPTKKREKLPDPPSLNKGVAAADVFFTPLKKKDIENYINYRIKNVWKTEAQIKLVKESKDNLKNQTVNYIKDLTDQVHVFYFQVRTFEEYFKAKEKIIKLLKVKQDEKKKNAKKNDAAEYIFIILFDEEYIGTDELTISQKTQISNENQTNFENMYRSFIVLTHDLHEKFRNKDVKEAEDDFQIFFLSKRTITAFSKPGDKGHEKKNDKEVSGEIKYLEPDTVILKFGKDENMKTIVFLSPKKIDDLETSRLPRIEGIKNPIYITNSKKDAVSINIKAGKDVRDLSPKPSESPKRYYIDLDWKEYFATLENKEEEVSGFSLENEKSDDEEYEKLKDEPPAPRVRTTSAKPNVPRYSSLAGTSTAAAAAKKPSISVETQTNNTGKPKKPVFKIEDTQPYVNIDLGDQSYKIRAYDEANVAAWKAGKFTEDETLLLQAIGFDDEFIQKTTLEPVSDNDEILEKRKELVAGRGTLLEILSSTTCLNTSDFMMKSECEFMRDYLQNLLYVRQIDRIRAITQQLSGIDDFEVEVAKVKGVLRETAAAKTAADAAAKAGKNQELAAEHFAVDILEMLNPILQKTAKKLKQKLPPPFDKIPLKTMLDAFDEMAESTPVSVSAFKPGSGPGPGETSVPEVTMEDETIVPGPTGKIKSRSKKAPTLTFFSAILTDIDTKEPSAEASKEPAGSSPTVSANPAGASPSVSANPAGASPTASSVSANPEARPLAEHLIGYRQPAAGLGIKGGYFQVERGGKEGKEGLGRKDFEKKISTLIVPQHRTQSPSGIGTPEENEAIKRLYDYFTGWDPNFVKIPTKATESKIFADEISRIVEKFYAIRPIKNINEFNLHIVSKMKGTAPTKEKQIQDNAERLFNTFKSGNPMPAGFEEFQPIVDDYEYVGK